MPFISLPIYHPRLSSFHRAALIPSISRSRSASLYPKFLYYTKGSLSLWFTDDFLFRATFPSYSADLLLNLEGNWWTGKLVFMLTLYFVFGRVHPLTDDQRQSQQLILGFQIINSSLDCNWWIVQQNTLPPIRISRRILVSVVGFTLHTSFLHRATKIPRWHNPIKMSKPGRPQA